MKHVALAASMSPVPAQADRGDGYRQHERQHVEQRDTRHAPRRYVERGEAPAYNRQVEHRRMEIERPRSEHREAWRPVYRERFYRGIPVYRHHGHRYPGYGFYYSDRDAFPWIAFTVLSLAIMDQLDEHQQRLHEQAFVRATTLAAGDTVYWQDEHSTGSISVNRIWYDRRGRQCRDLVQTVNSRMRSETGYATVCQRGNGSWEVTSGRALPIR